jgi:hypothetical protein
MAKNRQAVAYRLHLASAGPRRRVALVCLRVPPDLVAFFGLQAQLPISVTVGFQPVEQLFRLGFSQTKVASQ